MAPDALCFADDRASAPARFAIGWREVGGLRLFLRQAQDKLTLRVRGPVVAGGTRISTISRRRLVRDELQTGGETG